MKLSSEIVIKYLDEWPNVPNRTLAKKIFAEEPELFNSFEHVRGIIRMYRGSYGERHRRLMKTTKYYGTGNPLKLPDSEAEDDTVFHIPKQYNKVGVLADIHVPYHDVEALTVAIQTCKDKKCKAIL